MAIRLHSRYQGHVPRLPAEYAVFSRKGFLGDAIEKASYGAHSKGLWEGVMLKAIRSNKVYVPLTIILGAVGLFALYYFFYVSWQRSYASDRAFRLLSVV